MHISEQACGWQADPYALAYPESAPFWQAAETGTLLLPQCVRCECFHWHPRAFCPFCKAPDPRWTASSGQGEIFSFSVARTATPYVVAYVRLAEGPLMLTNIVDCDPARRRAHRPARQRPLPPDAARPAAAGVRPGARSRQGLETCIPEIASPVAVSCWPRGPWAWPSRAPPRRPRSRSALSR
ncbi:hypothetical protein NB2BOR_A12850 [Bordetella parapertussis]|nr:hypothetical protein NB2BOR_A12850 [Bordetella parapertussis]